MAYLSQYDEYLQKTVKRNIEQHLIITFSFKYRDYLRCVRDRGLKRAKKLIEQWDEAIKRKGENDVREYIREISCTSNGEVADNRIYCLNDDAIDNAAHYDGFYAVYTSLDTKNILYPESMR